MQYRELVKGAEKVSLLGYGCMRFPTKGGRIDIETTEKQILHAYELGVNYFDTAYIYHGGKSEGAIGDILKRNSLRDKVFIADKLPTFLLTRPAQIEEFFATQLKRLSTDYIDYYLMHMLDSYKGWQTLKKAGIEEFIQKKQAEGSIKHIGFSFHGRPEEFIKILEDYPWDFTQVQFNYLDEHQQAGIAGIRRARELGIGVVVMEPLRGGNLASKAPTKVREQFESYPERYSPAYWAMRWIFNHPEVGVVLSGMNEISQIEENAHVADITMPHSMTQSEIELIDRVKELYRTLTQVPCTGCNYCMPCPFGVDIPAVFNDFNSKYFFGKSIGRIQYLYRAAGGGGAGKSGANLCTGCGKCAKHCPQHIDIPHKLAQAHKELDNKLLRAVITVVLNHNNKKRARLGR